MDVQILGILNVTSDSFSDGGRFLNTDDALEHAAQLRANGAHIIDIGAVSSNPLGQDVPVEEEIRRLDQVIPPLLEKGFQLSVDTFRTPVQKHALSLGVHFLNDIAGFSDRDFFPALAASQASLIVMHSVQRGRARSDDILPEHIEGLLFDFFDERLAALQQAGISNNRLIIDPGMGFFLGKNPLCSIRAIELLPRLHTRYSLPVLASVSRKSFLGAITGRPVEARGDATLAAEIVCIQSGAAYIRTHRPEAVRDALLILGALDAEFR